MNKSFRIIISLFLVIALMCSLAVVGFAKQSAELYSSTISAQAGKTVTVPVYIKNNPGIMGYKIVINYDNKVFQPVRVVRGNVASGGMFNDNVGTNISNDIIVLWCNSSNCFENGLLFSVEFNTNINVNGTHTINVSIDSDDTFNENWQNVDIKGTTVSVDFGGESTKLSFWSRMLMLLKAIWAFLRNLFG